MWGRRLPPARAISRAPAPIGFVTAVHAQDAALVRLERLVATRLGTTRQAAAALIKTGRVAVHGEREPFPKPAHRVPGDARLTLDGEILAEIPLLCAFNKPMGVQCSMGDPLGRPSLVDHTPSRWVKQGLHPVGRLDADTTGLLLFSRDGALTQRLLHPRHDVEREYVAHVAHSLPPDLRTILAQGVQTADGTYPARLVDSGVGTGDGMRGGSGGDGDGMSGGGGDGGSGGGVGVTSANIGGAGEEREGAAPDPVSGGLSWVRVAVTEGKHRMVRRMLANLGLPVIALHRVRYGPVLLGNLQEGEWCPVAPDCADWAEQLRRRGRCHHR